MSTTVARPGESRAAQRLACAIALSLAFTAGVARADPELTVSVGNVEIGVGDPPAWRPASAGMRLQPGQALRTGRAARAELALGGSTVRLYENTVLRIPAGAFAAGKTSAVDLERGSGIFDVEKRPSGESFEVRTPEAVVMVKGTRFVVDLDLNGSAVSVFHGLVGVRALGELQEHEVLVRPGLQAIGSKSMPFDLRLDHGGDPWEGWTSGKGRRPALDTKPRDVAERTAREELAREVERKLRTESGRDSKRGSKEELARSELRDRIGDGQDVPAHPDGVADSPLADVQESVAEGYVEQGLNGPGNAAPQNFDVEFVDGSGTSGPDRVVFFRTDGSSLGQLTKGDLQQIASTGNTSLYPTDVLQNLVLNQTDPVHYADVLGHMLDNL